ncbi:MAG: P-loop NTPase [Chloroflexia bacterium]
MFRREKKTAVLAEDVMAALATVQEPELGKDLVTLKMIEDLKIEGGAVSFTVVLTTPACPLKGRIESEVRAAVEKAPGVEHIDVKFNSRVAPKFGSQTRQVLPGVAHAFAVASGKGGVGKSTISVGIAVALQQSGARVGLLDADVYGPNIPMMMGVESLLAPRAARYTRRKATASS